MTRAQASCQGSVLIDAGHGAAWPSFMIIIAIHCFLSPLEHRAQQLRISVLVFGFAVEHDPVIFVSSLQQRGNLFVAAPLFLSRVAFEQLPVCRIPPCIGLLIPYFCAAGRQPLFQPRLLAVARLTLEHLCKAFELHLLVASLTTHTSMTRALELRRSPHKRSTPAAARPSSTSSPRLRPELVFVIDGRVQFRRRLVFFPCATDSSSGPLELDLVHNRSLDLDRSSSAAASSSVRLSSTRTSSSHVASSSSHSSTSSSSSGVRSRAHVGGSGELFIIVLLVELPLRVL
ncbi:hypothetical protein C8R44DRAFT_896163 [Mycena epipterygia]|nr:hypothetical protein C8R44DRAFT_896163 [Mycena epipterygia]